MNNTLLFILEAMKTVAAAPAENVPALDRIMLQAQAQIAQERLLGVIERLISPGPVTHTAASSPDTETILARLLADIQGKEPSYDTNVHPSPFSGDIDLGPDEPKLTPEEREADDQLKAEIAAVTQAATEALLKNRRDPK